jgi:hypothetical protein
MILDWLRRKPPIGYDELSDKIDHVERQVKMLELEWESTYNKLRAMLARMNKREQRETEVTPSAHSADGNDGNREPDDIDRIIALRRGRR